MKSKKLSKKQIEKRIMWLDSCMANFTLGYGDYLWKEFNKKMDEGLYPNLVFPVVSVLFGGDDNEKLGKELHNFMNKNMQFATISNNFSIDEELKNYKQFEKIMIWFANEYMIQIFDSLDYETQKYMQNLFKNINKNDKK